MIGIGEISMKKSPVISLSTVRLISMNTVALAETVPKKVLHNDHIGFQASVKKDVPKLQRIQCTDRGRFNMSQMGLILTRKAYRWQQSSCLHDTLLS